MRTLALFVAVAASEVAGAEPKCPASAQPEWQTADARTKRELARACLALPAPVRSTLPVAPPVISKEPEPEEPVEPRPVMWGMKVGVGPAVTPVLRTGGGCIACDDGLSYFGMPAIGFEFSVAFAPRAWLQLGPLLRVEGGAGPGSRTLATTTTAFFVSGALGARVAAWFARVWGVGLQVELGAMVVERVNVKSTAATVLVTPQLGAALIPARRFGAQGQHQLGLELRIALASPAMFGGRYQPKFMPSGSALLSWTTLF